MRVRVSRFEYVVKTHRFDVNTLILRFCYIINHIHFTVIKVRHGSMISYTTYAHKFKV